MSRGFPSMTALLGLLAIAGYQNRDKLATLSVLLVEVPRQHRGNRGHRVLAWVACSTNSGAVSAVPARVAS